MIQSNETIERLLSHLRVELSELFRKFLNLLSKFRLVPDREVRKDLRLAF